MQGSFGFGLGHFLALASTSAYLSLPLIFSALKSRVPVFSFKELMIAGWYNQPFWFDHTLLILSFTKSLVELIIREESLYIQWARRCKFTIICTIFVTLECLLYLVTNYLNIYYLANKIAKRECNTRNLDGILLDDKTSLKDGYRYDKSQHKARNRNK